MFYGGLLRSGPYQMQLSDELVLIDTSVESASIALPRAAEIGMVYHVADATGGAGLLPITMSPDTGEQIEGLASVEIAEPYGFRSLLKVSSTQWIDLCCGDTTDFVYTFNDEEMSVAGDEVSTELESAFGINLTLSRPATVVVEVSVHGQFDDPGAEDLVVQTRYADQGDALIAIVPGSQQTIQVVAGANSVSNSGIVELTPGLYRIEFWWELDAVTGTFTVLAGAALIRLTVNY